MKRLIILLLSALLLPSAFLEAKRVLYIGDSITDGGWGNSGGGAKPSDKRNHWDLNHIYGHSYMFLCAAHYMAYYPEQEHEFFNRGISGNTLADLEARWKKDAIRIHPDVLSVLIGTNDVGGAIFNGDETFDFDNWESRYRALLDKSLAANPRLKIVLCTPFIAPTGNMRKSDRYELREKWVKECAGRVRRIANDYHATLVPFDDMFADIMQSTPDGKGIYWIWDGIHPTAAGHQRMADLWIKCADQQQLIVQ